MSLIPPLYRGTFRLMRRRLIRSLGYAGPRPDRAFGIVTAGVLSADAAATCVVGWVTTGQVQSNEFMALFLPTMSVVTLYALAGPLLLLAESSQRKGGSLTSVLTALPVRPRDIARHTWSPVLILATAVTAALVPAVVSILVCAGSLAVVDAVLVAITTVALSDTTTLLGLALVKLLLRSPASARAHYPLALLLSLGATIAVLASLLTPVAELHPATRVLVMPDVLDRLHSADVAAGWFVPVVALSTLMGCGAALAAMSLDRRPPSGQPWPRWRIRIGASILTGEFIHAMRSAAVVSNLGAAIVVNSALAVMLGRLDPEVVSAVAASCVSVGLMLAGLPARMLRGLYARIQPPQAGIGCRRNAWFVRLSACAVGVNLLGGLPLLWLVTDAQVRAALSGPAVIVSMGCSLGSALGLMWVLPSDANDPLGQFVGAAAYMIASGATTWAATSLLSFNPVVSMGWSVAVGVLWLMAGFRAEIPRWHRPPTRASVSPPIPSPTEVFR